MLLLDVSLLNYEIDGNSNLRRSVAKILPKMRINSPFFSPFFFRMYSRIFGHGDFGRFYVYVTLSLSLVQCRKVD